MDMIKAGNWKGVAHVQEHTGEMVKVMKTFAGLYSKYL
jgi:hypothetical protein